MVRLKYCSFGRKVLAMASPFLAIIVAFSWLGFSSIIACAQDKPASKDYEDFDASNFDGSSVTIDNAFFPLKPGTRLVWEGTTIDDEGEAVPHRVVFNVTDLTKEIAGVQTVVCWDQDYSADELAETEIVFFAQDKDGTVWHFGQYPEEYEEGKFLAAPAWIHGLEGGVAGIMMKAKPQMGTPSYSQGWGPAVGWTDRGQTHEMGQKTCVPVDCYEDVLVVKETATEEPNAFQLKYYAKGVGNIKVGWGGGGEKTKETLDLVEFKQLSDKELAQANAEALKLEKRAYDISKNVYAHTKPAEKRKLANKGMSEDK